MNKMFGKGTELMSAEEIVIAHGENEMVSVTAKEFAELELALLELSAIKQVVENWDEGEYYTDSIRSMKKIEDIIKGLVE